MDEPLRAHTLTEGRYYLMVTACESCGKGPWAITSTEASQEGGKLLTTRARCEQCGSERPFRFLCEGGESQVGSEVERINPTDEPSRIVDLGQWLSLFYMLTESAASDADKVSARRTGFRATLCLNEALKFYGDDELPEESAFFSERTLITFREHPEKFARQRLRDMRAKLPALPKMARSVRRDEQAAKKKTRWWAFWK